MICLGLVGASCKMADPQADITLVIAARDVERFLGATVQSVSDQSHIKWALIIVVDSARDGTTTIAQERAADDRRISVITGEFGGVSRARNRGLEAVETDFVLFLDGDDLLTPDALERYVAALIVPAAPVAVVAGHAKIDEEGRPIAGEDGSARPMFPGAFPALLERNIIVNGGTIAMHTASARAAGGYDPDLRMGEDWEFWVRLALLGPMTAVSGSPTLLYRQRQQSAMSRERGPLLALQTGAIDKIFANPALKERVLARDLANHRRAASIDLHWTATRAALHRGDWLRFAALAGLTVVQFPDSLLKSYIWRYFGHLLGRLFTISR